MQQRYNEDEYSTEIHTIYSEYIILCIKETMIMNIQLKFNTKCIECMTLRIKETRNMDIQFEM